MKGLASLALFTLSALVSITSSLNILRQWDGQQPSATLMSSDSQKHIHWECKEACEGADSSCITECETEVYNCIMKFQDVANQRPSTLQSKEAEEHAEECRAEVLKDARAQSGPSVGDQRGR
mmetsp:Transcript_96394/g.152448  ORF Transcript_96394/g.152448 Transcript_96394/m.152448 type:complete len:122 (+) Transcript_96394:71-436(+)|eukprot:CAMPEP_0169139276 /NCGR_PEP_ID=MMETSP1015-20121227/42865_1 /TAXON_ID=342587 /ORGANISM="Karlodinium micrum, Strain CCMP2283" /LENGTH=121 /DNA_ID=CAMNT_0009204935 /DNA_START=65 /DNA_END=430 /DNA_ORIENTATION=+